jgi:hypothetical protein
LVIHGLYPSHLVHFHHNGDVPIKDNNTSNYICKNCFKNIATMRQ